MIKNKKREKIKVIYCMGSGRSGSTLLGIILGNHPEIVSPGEINNITRLPEENFNCSCGKRVANCSFWVNVMDDWKNSVGNDSVQQTIEDIKKVENFKSPLSWLKVIFKYSTNSKHYQDYHENTYNFFNSIIKQSGKSVIIDISKNPLRALVLLHNPNIDLRLIHLVRDGRGVAWSLNKFTNLEVKQKSILRTALFWLIVNKQSNFVRKKAKNSGLIKYEDFASFPENTLEKIGSIAGIDPKPLISIIKLNLASENSHIMAGNKLRREKSIKINLNTEWKEKLDPKKQKTFLRIASRTMEKYGYYANDN